MRIARGPGGVAVGESIILPSKYAGSTGGVVDISAQLASKDDHVRHHAERALKESNAMRACMSEPGALKLPPLLEARRLEHGITDGAFRRQPIYDRIYVHQVSEYGDKAGGHESLVINPEAQGEEHSCPQGILVAAGLGALDALRAHGVELGHMCSFVRQAPFRREVDRHDGYRWYVLVFHAGDLIDSQELREALFNGEMSIEFVVPGQQHMLVHKDGTKTAPVSPFQASDY